jgi:D-alanine--poly(phosphoribitol) ligase subunit 1
MGTNYQYNLGQLFDSIATKNKDKIALKKLDQNHTFDELNSISNQLAHFIIDLEIEQNDVVAIFNNKSLYSYALMLACSKIGVIYTNLDPKSPDERLSKMLVTCSPKILFYSSENHSKRANTVLNETQLIDYSNIDSKIKHLSRKLPYINQNVIGNTSAYIMFTSGSTGFPKGVIISHQNLLNFINWSKSTYKTTCTDVFTNINPMHFDNSVFDFYSSLYTGASIISVGDELTLNPRNLIKYLNEMKPTIWFSVPSLLVYVLNMRALTNEDLPSLKTVTFGGEGFPKNQLRKLWGFWGDRIRFVNVYGPTECTCICSSYDVTETDLENEELLPLGPIAPNFYELVLDEEGNQVEEGTTGELCLGGPNVGIGYYNNESKTASAFVKNPLRNQFLDIIYKTGDLVKKSKGSNLLHFCGRKDNQIKRMGYRIELEEIENALNSIDSIQECAVIFIDNEKYKTQIIGCIKTNITSEANYNNFLKNLLPLYMIPDSYYILDSLPKNQNGKIDRIQLKEQYLLEN